MRGPSSFHNLRRDNQSVSETFSGVGRMRAAQENVQRRAKVTLWDVLIEVGCNERNAIDVVRVPLRWDVAWIQVGMRQWRQDHATHFVRLLQPKLPRLINDFRSGHYARSARK